MDSVDVDSASELGQRLGERHDSGRRYQFVVLIGHANEAGLELGSGNQFVAWPIVAKFLAPFPVRRLLLLGCRASRSAVAGAMFDRLPGLLTIDGSPVFAYKMWSWAVVALLPLWIQGVDLEPKAFETAQLGSLALGGQLSRWQRGESDDPLAPVIDIANDLIERVMDDVHKRGRGP